MTRTPDDIVKTEVLCRMSGLVATLAKCSGHNLNGDSLYDQAAELAAPIDDWEEPARDNGYLSSDATTKSNDLGFWIVASGDSPDQYDSWQEACEENDIEPYQREVYEHWVVTDWLADHLLEQGEKVDKDFAGLCVWARTTTGQTISMDGVFKRIVAAIEARYQAIIRDV